MTDVPPVRAEPNAQASVLTSNPRFALYTTEVRIYTHLDIVSSTQCIFCLFIKGIVSFQQLNDHYYHYYANSYLQMSVPPTDDPQPETPLLLAVPALDLRWVHAGAQQLNLLPTPITSASNSYEAFSESESSRIELRWQSTSESDRLKTIKLWGRNDGEGAFQTQEETIKQGEKIGHDEEVTEGSKGCNSIDRHSIDGTDAHPVGSKVKSEDGEEHLDPDVDDMSFGEDQINKQYHALLLEARKENDDLDLVQGVPVSQVSAQAFWPPKYSE